MENELTRLEMMIGNDNVKTLKDSKVIIFGVGGVGGYVVEALARCGVGTLALVDNDVVSISNINRQIIALHSTIGKDKVQVIKERVLDINPNCNVQTIKTFVNKQTIEQFNLSDYDYVVDAIDFLEGKLEIIKSAQKSGAKVISSMGTGNKINPSALRIDNISKTKICPLAKKLRKMCKNEGILPFKVLFSIENPISPQFFLTEKRTPCSCSFVPSVAGLMIAGEIVRELTNFFGEGINNS